MRRTFTLQLHDVPQGRAFTCPTCGAASFHPPTASVVCRACSPFLKVEKKDGQITAVCRWAQRPIVIFNVAEAMAWCDSAGDLGGPVAHMPKVVRESLQSHFETSNFPICIVPPTTEEATADPMVSIGQGGVITVTAGADIRVGEMLFGGTPRTAIGHAVNSAKKGEQLKVELMPVPKATVR